MMRAFRVAAPRMGCAHVSGEEPAHEVENLPAQGQQRRVFKERLSLFRISAENSAGRDSRGEKADLQHFREIPSLCKNWDLSGVRGGRREQMAVQLLVRGFALGLTRTVSL